MDNSNTQYNQTNSVSHGGGEDAATVGGIGAGTVGGPSSFETSPEAEQACAEMESVLYSISHGQVKQHQPMQSKVKYQAFSAAISSQSHIDLVLSYN